MTQPELKDWIKHTQNRYVYENVGKNWKEYDKDNDGRVSWAEFKNASYGYYEGIGKGEPCISGRDSWTGIKRSSSPNRWRR